MSSEYFTMTFELLHRKIDKYQNVSINVDKSMYIFVDNKKFKNHFLEVLRNL